MQISIEQGQQESEHSEIISIHFRKPSGIVFCCCCFMCGFLFFSVHGGVHRGRPQCEQGFFSDEENVLFFSNGGESQLRPDHLT